MASSSSCPSPNPRKWSITHLDLLDESLSRKNNLPSRVVRERRLCYFSVVLSPSFQESSGLIIISLLQMMFADTKGRRGRKRQWTTVVRENMKDARKRRRINRLHFCDATVWVVCERKRKKNVSVAALKRERLRQWTGGLLWYQSTNQSASRHIVWDCGRERRKRPSWRRTRRKRYFIGWESHTMWTGRSGLRVSGPLWCVCLMSVCL